MPEPASEPVARTIAFALNLVNFKPNRVAAPEKQAQIAINLIAICQPSLGTLPLGVHPN
jgi:hypothetical protein